MTERGSVVGSPDVVILSEAKDLPSSVESASDGEVPRHAPASARKASPPQRLLDVANRAANRFLQFVAQRQVRGNGRGEGTAGPVRRARDDSRMAVFAE